MYFAPGATHAPHHVPHEWADKYKGKFDEGWDKQREPTFARQKELGVIAPDAELTARHDEIPAWDDMPDDLRAGAGRARWRSTPASWSTPTTTSAGSSTRIEQLGVLDDTLIYYIIGDNGASAEGTINGAFNEMANFNGMAALETPEFMASKIDEFGTPTLLQPLRGRVGATRWTPPTSGPSRSPRTGGAPERHDRPLAQRDRREGRDRGPVLPRHRRGPDDPRGRRHSRSRLWSTASQQAPIEGTSMLYSFDDAEAPERHDLQYFEMFGNRGIYHKGWSAVTKHRTPWELVGVVLPAFDDDVWELYDGTKDWTQADDLSARCPKAARAAASVADRGDQVQRASDRRPRRERLNPDTRRAAAARPR